MNFDLIDERKMRAQVSSSSSSSYNKRIEERKMNRNAKANIRREERGEEKCSTMFHVTCNNSQEIEILHNMRRQNFLTNATRRVRVIRTFALFEVISVLI